MSGLFQAICRIGVFMICAQAVIHFRPQEAYEKYLKLLVSAMVLIQLFLPISRILFHGDSGEFAVKTQLFWEGLEAEMSAAESRAYETDALLEQMTLEEIRRCMEEEQAMEDTVDDTVDDTANDTSDGAVQIERVQVEEIQIRLREDSMESVSAE